MPLFTHTLTAPRDGPFLAEGRCDPVTKAVLQAGDVVVICAICRSAFLYDTWRFIDRRHCGQSSTLATLPQPFKGRLTPTPTAVRSWRRVAAVSTALIAVSLAVWWTGSYPRPWVSPSSQPVVNAAGDKTNPQGDAVVSGASLEPGTRVRRGRDWKWGDQDGGKGHLGTVTAPDRQSRGWWWVKWDGGQQNRYRWGVEGAFDLAVVRRGGAAGRSPSEGGPALPSTTPAPAPTPEPAAGRLDADDPLTIKGLGPIRIGMTTGEAASAIGQQFVGSPDERCAMLKPPNAPAGLTVMAVNGRIVRIDISGGAYRSKSGARVNDSEQHVMALYGGRLQVSDHKYVRGGHYLTFVPRDADDTDYRMVFETDGARITTFRAGKLPEVEWVEHCL